LYLCNQHEINYMTNLTPTPEAPFIFGKTARFNEFTDRENQTEQLIINFRSGTNTILISPRRWGKTSLILHTADVYMKRNKSDRVVTIDLNNIRSEQEFYEKYVNQIMRAASTKITEFTENARTFLSNFIPRISYSPNQQNEISVALDWETVSKDADEILNLPQKIAAKKGIRIIICLDEFQNIMVFDNPLAFQKKLRSHWQNHSRVTYCLYGSRRSLMTELFTHSSMPFYKFGDLMFLEKIEEKQWVKFFMKRFKDTGKKINADDAALIAQKVENHPFYAQQLAQLTWLRTKKTASAAIVHEAIERLMDQLSYVFQNLSDSLPSSQLGFLNAIINNETKLTSEAVISRYKLKSSAHVAKIKKALIDKDLIDYHNKVYNLNDPVFKLWLKTRYFI